MPDNDVDGNGSEQRGRHRRQARPQGLPVGPGGPLVPGVRRLLDPRRDAARAGRHRRAAREPRVRVGHRLRGALPVLHEHLRAALDPRSCAGGGHRRRAGPPRPRRVGDRRRRRHALDRWQPPDPRAASQREPEDHHVQQPDLRPHQGSVLADQRGRQDHEVVAVRLARHAVQPGVGRARRRGHVRRPHPRHGPQAHDGGVPPGARAPGRAFVEIYQNCNVFNDGAFEGITAKDARADMLIELEHGEPIRFGADNERGVVLNEFGECEIVNVADVGEDRLLVHDEHRDDPALAFALSRLSSSPTMPTPIGVFRDDPASDLRGRGAAPARSARSERQGPGDLASCIGAGATWDSRLTQPRPRGARSVVEAAEHHARCAAWARRRSSSPACGGRRPPRRGSCRR